MWLPSIAMPVLNNGYEDTAIVDDDQTNNDNSGLSLSGDLPSVFKAVSHSSPPNKKFYSSEYKGPFNTNRWWINLVVGKGDNPVQTYPYQIKALDNSSILCYPNLSVSGNTQISSFGEDWTVGGKEGELSARVITADDDLSVTVEWQSQGQMKMRAPLVKGMPFATYEMKDITPTLKTTHSIKDMKSQAEGQTVVSLNDGSSWLIVSNPPIKWEQADTTLSGSNGYEGVVRLAHAGSDAGSNLAILTKYADTYPSGGTVQYTPVKPGEDSDVKFTFKTSGDGDVLVFALPHHIDNMPSGQKVNLKGYRATKGPLTGIVGNTWTITEKTSSIGFSGPNEIDSSIKPQIIDWLKKDSASDKLDVTAPDPYFFGKGLAKIARLALIAEEVGDQEAQKSLVSKLKSLIQPWIEGKNEDPLVYDQSWGGIISAKGKEDSGADFGNGWYNDHHFHYGYFAYAGAVLAKNDKSWAQSPSGQFVLNLIRDYANPSRDDPKFAYLRHFDPYDGHSWAAGIFPFGDGRNQESSSEAINGYYGAYLYALAIGNNDLAQFYNLILTMEARSATRYWHPTSKTAKELYIDGFNQHHVAGIIWGAKIDYQTFFGANPEFIYGIQMLPFTPATGLIVHKEWVKDSWSDMEKAAQSAASGDKQGWAQFLYTVYGLVDKSSAAEKVVGLKPDDGNTVTNALYWIATN
ncbi:hypothetical protein H4219_004455 [Mycoemilia scoparia]|uniref:glucan endo-1,3-beta-D-glucosidase n=1 Tax=Mycoemilia scoparia TaxID=417184 RepID=A0A9W7ZRN1_9FUNG|nr:hypothetical protein H4219_004455 [Mycoemilia scoparia]